jgi:Tfp pilus assembly protein PilF
MQYLPAIILGLIVLVIITRPFTILFHELGHAIPAILLTKEGATVYVGSYGDKKQSFKITIGGLEIWFRYNLIKWRGGLCIPKAEEISLTKRAIYTLCGPLFSLFIAACIFYLTLSHDLHGLVKLICAFALGSTILDLFTNLIPHKIKVADGSTLFSDGYLLFNLQKLKKFPDEYADAVDSYSKKEYDKTSKIFEDFINRGLVNEDVYRYASTSNIFIKNYEKAHEIQKEFESKYELTSDDFYNLGLISLLLNMEDEKAKYFRKSLEQNPDNSHTLNAIGYDLNKKGEFQEAILLFNKAIEIQPVFASAYNNRGHAKIEIGQFDEGVKDIQYSLLLDSENSYVYRTLGIYHLKMNQNDEALKWFLQSQQIDKDTDLIEEYINKAKALV